MAFLGLVCAVLLCLMGINYFVDPFGYFSFQAGDYDAIDFPVDTTYYQRELKLQHVLHNSDQYDAYLLGGSKGGSYPAEMLQRLDGYRYYNLYATGGSFYEYELETKFLIENADPKKILLHISGGEVRFLERNQVDITNKIPALLTGKSRLIETVDFLFKDITESFERMQERKSGKEYYELMRTGERNLRKYYEKMETDWDGLTKRSVLQPFDTHMARLFTTDTDAAYLQESLDSIERMKKMCEDNGVEFMVIVAPSFIGEMSEHESSGYRDFLAKLALITDYWDFSGYHDIDLNPYNFYNEGHYYYEVVDLMMNTINGTDSYPGFGCYVTRENAMEHVAAREADYKRLQQEYLETGTIQLQGKDADSCLLKR